MRNPVDKEKRCLLKQLACLPPGAGVSMLMGNGIAQALGCGGPKSLVCIFLEGGANSLPQMQYNGRNKLAKHTYTWLPDLSHPESNWVCKNKYFSY